MYHVKDTSFPETLKGLTAAIKLAVEFAQVEPVDVLREDGSVAFHVDKQQIKKQRKGYYAVDNGA